MHNKYNMLGPAISSDDILVLEDYLFRSLVIVTASVSGDDIEITSSIVIKTINSLMSECLPQDYQYINVIHRCAKFLWPWPTFPASLNSIKLVYSISDFEHWSCGLLKPHAQMHPVIFYWGSLVFMTFTYFICLIKRY